MNAMRYISAVMCCCSVWAGSPAQEMVYTELPTQKQLPVAHIHRALQDSEGYMWYATEGGGLCRDDGYEIDVFRSDARTPRLLGSNTLTCLAEDGRGRIWIGTDKGACRLDKADYGIVPVGEGTLLEQQRTEAVMAASDGTVWAAAGGRIYHYSDRDELLEEFSSEYNGQVRPVAGFYEDSRNRVWVMQQRGGLLCHESGGRHLTAAPWPCDVAPTMMVEDGQTGRFWVGTWGQGIVSYRPEAAQGRLEVHPATCSGMERSLILGFHWDESRHILWTVAMDGLYAYRMQGRELRAVDLSAFLPGGKKILDLPTADRWGNIWVPGYSPHTFILSGVQRHISRDAVRPMTEATGYPVMVDRIVEDGAGYWIWQGRTGLSYYRPRQGSHFVMGDGLPGGGDGLSYGKALEKCGNAAGIWACHGDRIVRLWHDGKGFGLQEAARLPEGYGTVSKMREDKSGNLWVATEAGLHCYTPDGRLLDTYAAQEGGVRDFVLLPGGEICCVYGTGGLAFIRGGKTAVVLDEDKACTAIATGHDGKIWVATSQGEVYTGSPGDRTFLPEPNAGNRNGDAIKAVETDPHGHVWMLADQYVKEYSPATRSFRLLHNDDREVRMDYFHTLRRMGDSICIGGIGAFCKVAPSAALDRPAQPVRPVVSAYEVDGVRHFVSPGRKRVEFTAGQDNISFSFSSLDHLHARQVSYACRLEGRGDDWTYLPQGTNTVTFYNLSAGDYTLEVKATDMHGSWGAPQECLSLRKLPPWYATWWAYTLYITALASLLGGGLYAYLRQMRHKQQQKAEERLTQMKFRFFTNVSHELRTPLTLIITPLGNLLDTVADSALRRQLQAIHRHACELLELINHLLDFRKLETGEVKVHLHEGSMGDFVRSACHAFEPLAENRQVDFRVSVPENGVYMRFDKEKMHRVLYNLLGNAFKFTPEGGMVAVSLAMAPSGEAVITVRDNGCGMTAEEAAHAFDRYYQGSRAAGHTGSGIGLHLVKTYMQMQGGRVEVDSKPGQGTEFRVYLPLQQAPSETTGAEHREPDMHPPKKRHSVMVVEDNGELRTMLVQHLSAEYNIHQAADGHEALELLEHHEVDIVVSDIMMPGMDGLELCRTVKSDVRTSHIFVILLTAYSGDAHALQGYKAGADCYLAKPFSMEILDNRIRHFMALQDRRKLIFLSGVEFRAEEVATTKVDEDFLQKAVACVERNLDNTGYTVEQFSADMCMSRMNLYRKLQSLTGQSPSEFIRGIRLKKAAQILSSHRLPVSEVADQVGFSTPGYFSKCFKEMFGVLPTQYNP